MTRTERQRVYETAVRQLHADAEARQDTRTRRERLQDAFGHRCASCNDPDSDPTFDGHDGICCDICGADWR